MRKWAKKPLEPAFKNATIFAPLALLEHKRDSISSERSVGA